MKQILVISGKGGTGKTILTASLAALFENKIMVDCDVDAANLHLLLNPNSTEKHEFKGLNRALIDKNTCIKCGRCIEVCRFNAIGEDFKVNPALCEGCGVCKCICPVNAVEMKEHVCGEWFVSKTKYGTLIHAKLGIAEENSGKLVVLLKEKAKALAQVENSNYIIIDGAPGIACPVIASLSGVDLAVVVTEPTLSGMHDLKRVIELTSHFNIKSSVCINKFDINIENAKAIRGFCKKNKVTILSEIPFDKEIVNSLVACTPFVEFASRGQTKDIIVELSRKLTKQF